MLSLECSRFLLARLLCYLLDYARLLYYLLDNTRLLYSLFRYYAILAEYDIYCTFFYLLDTAFSYNLYLNVRLKLLDNIVASRYLYTFELIYSRIATLYE